MILRNKGAAPVIGYSPFLLPAHLHKAKTLSLNLYASKHQDSAAIAVSVTGSSTLGTNPKLNCRFGSLMFVFRFICLQA